MKEFHPQNGLFPGTEVIRNAAQPNLQYLFSREPPFQECFPSCWWEAEAKSLPRMEFLFAKSCLRFVLARGIRSNEGQANVFSGELGRQVLGTYPQKMPDAQRS